MYFHCSFGAVEIYAISISKGVIKNGYHGTCYVDGRRLDARCGGAEVDVTLLPKMKMEVVVSKVPVETVVETVKKVLYTGHIGDGKIFVYDVENVIKVRTGAEGFDALQDDE